MMTPTLVRSLDVDLRPEHGFYSVRGITALGGVIHGKGGPARLDADWLTVVTHTDDRGVRIRLEAWDAAPPTGADDPDGSRTRTALSASGLADLRSSTGEHQATFLLGPPAFSYGLRIDRRTHAEERHLLQFWPLDDVFNPFTDARPVDVDESAAEEAGIDVATRATCYSRSSPPDWPGARRNRFIGAFGRLPGPAGEAHGEDLRIAAELNPDARPTYLIARTDVQRTAGPVLRGHSYRAWTWRDDAPTRPDARELVRGSAVSVTADITGRRTFVSMIVTVLHVAGDRLEVRAAAPAESARVTATEQDWYVLLPELKNEHRTNDTPPARG